jgi:hypothetical protein
MTNLPPPGQWRDADGNLHPLPAGSKPPKPARPWYRRKRIWIPSALVVLLIIAGITGGGTKKTTNTKTANAAATTSTVVKAKVTTTTRVTPTTGPATTLPRPVTTAPTVPPTPAPTTAVAATAPATTAPPATVAAQLCGAPSNPMGYNFCGRGSNITQPDPSTCNYFNCIASFSSGTGYMIECQDTTYSMSGGHSGACSHHGGELRPVYSGP